jgi:hypothetical protein
MMLRKIALGFPGTLLVMSLFGCGGGGSSSFSNGDFVAYIRGNLSGLSDGKLLALQNNGDEIITLTQNGAFRFDKRLFIFENYDVKVRNQPADQQCVVTNSSGSVNSKSEDVTNIEVSCK